MLGARSEVCTRGRAVYHVVAFVIVVVDVVFVFVVFVIVVVDLVILIIAVHVPVVSIFNVPSWQSSSVLLSSSSLSSLS